MRSFRAHCVCITFLAVGGITGVPATAAVYPSVSVTTDYRYNGVSYSDGEPVLQGSLHWIASDYLYAGIWASGIDFNDPGNTSIEVDLYAGTKFRWRDFELDFEALYSSYPDKSFPGPTYDFLQVQARVRRLLYGTTFGLEGAWTPGSSYGAGIATRVGLEAARPITSNLDVSANIGRRWVEVGVDRSFWDAGATMNWRHFSFDVRYTDTNLNPNICRFDCDATVVATLTINLW